MLKMNNFYKQTKQNEKLVIQFKELLQRLYFTSLEAVHVSNLSLSFMDRFIHLINDAPSTMKIQSESQFQRKLQYSKKLLF